MRLLDKLITQTTRKQRQGVIKFVSDRRLGCVYADEIYHHVIEHGIERNKAALFMGCVAPWPLTWVEWQKPDASLQQGVMIRTDVSRDLHEDNMITLASSRWVWKWPGATFDINTKVQSMLVRMVQWDKSDGLLYEEIDMIVAYADDATKRFVAIGFDDCGGDITPEIEERWAKESIVAMMVPAAVCSFLSCKNVTTEDKTCVYAPQDKIRRRLKIPEIKRYTLVIDGHSTHRSQSAPLSETGVMPFHLCRGHFATYTNEKPLFGKLTGRFWVPAHMRGNKRNGEIIKDYKVSMRAAEGVEPNGERMDQDACGSYDSPTFSQAHE